MRTTITAILYNLFFVAPAELFLALFGRFFKKLRQGLKVRKNWERDLRKSIASLPKGPRILFHAASAGELQQALPVIRTLKSQNPELQCGISFYSVSGMNFFKGDPAVSFTTYLPFDSPKNSMLFMMIVRPKLYVVASWDAWFNHVLAAKNMGAKLYMVAAVLAPDSSRIRFPLKLITVETFCLFDHIYTVSESDSERIATLIGSSVPIETAGDPRYDHILEGIASAPSKLAETAIPVWNGVQIMTMGSVWEPDWEIASVPVLEMVQNGRLKLFVAPHQMHESFLCQIESSCRDAHVAVERYSRLSHYETPESLQVVIVDTIGVLAALYSKSSFAFIGGAFGKGVHNVAEPAAFGLPLWFGPKHLHSIEAVRAVERLGAVVVESVSQFRQDLVTLLGNEELAAKRSACSRSVVHDFAGATTHVGSALANILSEN